MSRHALALCGLLIVAILTPHQAAASDRPIDTLAEEYVRLVLRVGRYVPDYVDAYIGPMALKDAAAAEEVEKGLPYQRLCMDAERLLAQVQQASARAESESDKLRLAFIASQLYSLRSLLDLERGYKLSFDGEARGIYGVEAPRHDSTYYEELLVRLDSLLPGDGDLSDRYSRFQEKFIVPRHLVDTLIKICMAECRARTGQYIVLPRGESCRVELVGGQSWGGYNWFLGDLRSLIQIDTTGEQGLASLVSAVAHEGYPGHHLSNIVRENNLVKDSGWIEHSVFPLYCPQSVLDEGMAMLAPELVFPSAERPAFYKSRLFPILNLDTSLADPYCRMIEVTRQLYGVNLDVARAYLDGDFDSTRAIAWLSRYALTSPDGALRELAFDDQYRGYRLTYTVGEGLIGDYLERHGGTPDNPGKRWGLFYHLIAVPRPPSALD